MLAHATRATRLALLVLAVALLGAGYTASGQAQPAALPDLAGIAARFAPTVVNISMTGTRKVSTASGPAADAAGGVDAAPGADEPDAVRDFLRNFQQ